MQNQDPKNKPVPDNLEQMALMPDTTAAEQDNAPAAPVAAPGLKVAREAKRMSVGDAAYALKVSPRVIESIESADWEKLPGRTFTVGMLRAYGRLLEIPVDALIETVPGAGPAVRKAVAAQAPRSKPVASDRHNAEVKRQTSRMSRLGLVMMLVALVLAYAVPTEYWRVAVDEGTALYERLVHRKTADANPDAPAVVPSASTEPATAAQAPTEQQAQTSTGTLELRFAAPAWVEVRDYTGRIIYSQLNAAGSTQFITGAAPLDVMIGNAKQVQARWRDEPLKLDKLSSDDVARQILR